MSFPTYQPDPPCPHPMFLERRVYQGSSGKVYPNPITERVAQEAVPHHYTAIHLENDYLYVMILPELGGRIHVGYDKVAGYDFFYRQSVIKPALVGLLGPWISGGVEFNWPQHHRPSTFMPLAYHLEPHEDGAVTVWLSEHEPMTRMKGMCGVRLHPHAARVEVHGRLYNRTPYTQTFLWWANVGVKVHDQYQSVFPPDVQHVMDHARRAVSSFPEASGPYYGVDYPPGTRLDWYKNIPVPTSYMVTDTDFDFFGGYDHAAQAGFVHVADRHFAPGKKQWTWGDHPFGHAWNRHLTDHDGPYIELMAGVYTDNQPDFAWLRPFETKTFEQCWYPVQRIGPPKAATRHAALNLEVRGGEVHLGLAAAERLLGVTLELRAGERVRLTRRVDLEPGEPLLERVALEPGESEAALSFELRDAAGTLLLRYAPPAAQAGTPPEPAQAPPPPEEVESADELYTIGVHLEQYRQATRSPEPYWLEALRRDPLDSRANTALSLRALGRGEFESAARHARTALERLTRHNLHPPGGEAHYALGLAARLLNDAREAERAFAQAAWTSEFAPAARFALAELLAAPQPSAALGHLDTLLDGHADHNHAHALRALLRRQLGDARGALSDVSSVLLRDPLDVWALWLKLRWAAPEARADALGRFEAAMNGDVQTYLDLAHDLRRAGQPEEALAVLEHPAPEGPVARSVWVRALRADLCQRLGRPLPPGAPGFAGSGQAFASRLEDFALLEADPHDAWARYHLGNLLYDKGRRDEALTAWQRAVDLDPSLAPAWRNLGLARLNVAHDPVGAQAAYLEALRLAPGDARVLYELDQLGKRSGEALAVRLARLEARPQLVAQRDDLTLERAALLSSLERPAEALQALLGRAFQPWEGGEGRVLAEFVRAHLRLSRAALRRGDAGRALEHARSARSVPESLGEGKHLLTSDAAAWLAEGEALIALGRVAEAQGAFAQVLAAPDAGEMEAPLRVRALRGLGQHGRAHALLEQALTELSRQADAPAQVDYFATSLPNFALFNDDAPERGGLEHQVRLGLLLLERGEVEAARGALQAVLARDPAHPVAGDALHALEGQG